ncbi:endonuclease/exonuclease/phosphatase family protein [Vibrio sp. RE86]|uniref:endonuclease/exonuclease/phosphatase family protein n=1 Tax=Vibrio sp. RE86 TaxID=2607605 RepID=UPI0014933B88|nr:endonuclease/exonuclease/phosphatase family protein [Vibrio sp. RE86]NOH80070.1 endonuclease/exonuclease/phosphatase family protein [Vibrio sp. RE86]
MLNSHTLTFATANLFNFIEPPDAYYDFENIYDREQWEEKCRWTQEKVNELNADIIGLQEVFSIEAAKALFQDIGYPYFATVGTPHVESDYIYSQPVVAITSKYPILNCEKVVPPKEQMKGYITAPPAFSRSPLKATIDVPDYGEVSVYVCHLKSQRVTESSDKELGQPLLGKWLSSQQRGWEAVMLRLFMDDQYAKTPSPTIVLGDMNQTLESDITNPLITNLNNDERGLILKDSWELYAHVDSRPVRPPTHYHFAKGNVLDYVLMSQEFQPDSHYSIADVIRYVTLDHHLINPQFENDKQASDHAFVAVTVTLVV